MLKLLQRHFLLFTLSAAASLALLPAAQAGTVGPFTGSGPGTVTVSPNSTVPADQFTFNYGFNGTSGSWSFTALALDTGVHTINYSGGGDHAYYQASAYAGVFTTDANGTVTTQTLFSSGTFGPFSYSGTVSLNLVAGQTYGFNFSGSNFDSANYLVGNLQITDVTAVPEPSTYAMMAGGVGLLLVGQRLRRARQVA